MAEVAENSFCAICAMLFFSSFTLNRIRGLLKSCPIFGTTIFLSVCCSLRWHSCRRSIYPNRYPTDACVAGRPLGICQAQPVYILSAQRSYSKIPAICSQKQKKGTFICIYGKKVVPLYDFFRINRC